MELPWYPKLKAIVASSEPAANFTLATLIFISMLILFFGNAWLKALWVVYWVSP